MKYLINLASGKISIITLINGDIDSELAKFKSTLVDDEIIGYRLLTDSDIPESREFRDAWVDISESSKIDVDVVKAKEAKLDQLRYKRNLALEDLDPQFVKALSMSDEIKLVEIKAEQQRLRDITEPLKALQVSGINDDVAIANIKALGDVL